MKRINCPLCRFYHYVMETRDDEGNVVGYYCSKQKRMAVSVSEEWNGRSIIRDLRSFLVENVPAAPLKAVRPDKRDALVRKMAYLFIKDPRGAGIDYHWAAYHVFRQLNWLRNHYYRDGREG